MKRERIVTVGLGLVVASLITVASAEPNAADASIPALEQTLERIKAQNLEDLRELRELDAKLKALKGIAQTTEDSGSTAVDTTGLEHRAAHEQARSEASRSLEDLMQAEHVLFTRRFTFEPSISYTRYDRERLALSGFLALDAIFLGNIAVEAVASDTLTLGLGGRYGFTDRLSTSLNAPFIQRSTNYLKGGAGGSAAASDETSVSNSLALGDVSLGMSYRLAAETARNADWVVNVDVTAPTGKEPYGIPYRVIQRDAQGIVSFSVPEELPTGNGVWSVGTSVSFVKTAEPAILFGHLGYQYTLSESFADLDSDPNVISPGDIDLGDSVNYGLGLAFALNQKTSLSLSFGHKITQRAQSKPVGGKWQSVIGSNANAATLNLGLTYGLTPRTSLVTGVVAGLTEDASDFSLSIRLPTSF